MKEKAYIETSVISYLCSRPSRDLIIAAMQQVTHEWWDGHRRRYDCFVSDVVVEEVGQGDAETAVLRQQAIADLPVLAVNDDVAHLAEQIMKRVGMSSDLADDALHIAIAAVHGMEYLLTWNCAHIANPHWQEKFGKIIRLMGYSVPVMCTPQTLLEGE